MGSSNSFCDGLVHPKLLQDSCLEYLVSLTLELVHSYGYSCATSSREQASDRQEEELERGRTHFQPDVQRLLRNLKTSLGMNYILGPEGTLPAHFCDKLLAFLASRKILTDTLVKCVCHQTFGCVTKLPRSEALELTPDTLTVLVQQPLVELFLRFYQQPVFPRGLTPVPVHDLATILVNSPAAFTLRSLSIANVSFKGQSVDFSWLGCLKSLTRLQLENCNFSFDSEAYLATEIEKLPLITTLKFADSTLTALPCGSATLRQLTLPTARIGTSEKLLDNVLSLSNLVYLDVARMAAEDRSSLSTLQQNKDWVMKLSKLPQLRYIDLSFHTVKVEDMKHFDPPHHRMNFMGLLSTQACMRRDINSNVVS